MAPASPIPETTQTVSAEQLLIWSAALRINAYHCADPELSGVLDDLADQMAVASGRTMVVAS